MSAMWSFETLIAGGNALFPTDVIGKPQSISLMNTQGKQIGIKLHIGKYPVATFGNSHADFQMLQWTTAVERRRLRVTIDQNESKYEYDVGN